MAKFFSMNSSRLFLCMIFFIWMIGTVSCHPQKKVVTIRKCRPKKSDNVPVLTKSGLDPKNFIDELDGKKTALYTLTNDNGMEVCITNYGGRIVSIMVPDRDGVFKDVVLGFDHVSDYYPENNPTDLGATLGRYANRIVNGTFELDGVLYELPKNNGNNTLHGGPTGWQYQVYEVVEHDKNHIKFFRDSPDGDNDFPGHVQVYVTYTLTNNNSIEIHYEGTTDKPTVINMTNHSYFNLNGDPANNILDNILYINADNYTEPKEGNVPNGKIVSVLGTPVDFTVPKPVGQDIGKTDFLPITYGEGYDFNWVLNTNYDINQVAAYAYSPKTGISLEVRTDEPGLVFYSTNFLKNTKGKHGIIYNPQSAICLESGRYPDSPNHPEWPNVVYRPGDLFTSNCVYTFSIHN